MFRRRSCFRSARWWLSGLLMLATLCAGCGDEPGQRDEPAVPVEHPPSASYPSVSFPDSKTKAAYALERLERGPGDLRGLLVPEVHRRNLELALEDLVFFEPEAARLLSDPARIARITGDHARYGDAWHNILRAWIAFHARPAETVVAWTEPVLSVPLGEEWHTLRLEATRLLGLVDDPRAAELLLKFFEQSPADREIAAVAVSVLARRPSVRSAALDVALSQGAAALWEAAPLRIAAALPAREVDPSIIDALVWWHALTSGSGPRMDETLPHLHAPPWTQGRLGTDPRVPSAVFGPDGSGRMRYGSLEATVIYGSGWFATPLAVAPEIPVHTLGLTGSLPAAEARCLLASFGHAGYAAAVRRDLEREGENDGLYYAALHCMLAAAPASEAENLLAVLVELDAPGPWSPERVLALQRRVTALSTCSDPAAGLLLERVLREARPLDVTRPAVEQAYQILHDKDAAALRTLVGQMLEQGSPEDVGVALHLIRSVRDPLYLDLLERFHAGSTDAEVNGILRRTLIYIYSAGSGVEPKRLATFVPRYLEWLHAGSAAEFATLASGLLDFGDAGAQAFAAGLRGPERQRFLLAWPRGAALVPEEVAQAAIDGIDRTTEPAEFSYVLALAWSTFPTSAAPAVEALRQRLPTARRGPVDAALERILHRAPRHGDA
ncbi:MAG: hypothetical protein O2894_01675 [Planctomycetota bacterium]|nr:hypothetical protein [Planctomycetota bacterium]